MITIICFVLLAFLWVALYDSNRFVVTCHRFGHQKLKKSVRVVVLTDLHNKRYGKNNERLLEAVRECAPELVLVAGDMLTAKPGASFLPALNFVEALAKEYPVYYASGNHEHRLKLYPEQYGDMAERYEQALAEAGVVRLVNSHIALKEYGLAIYGAEIDRFYYKRFGVQNMPETYMESILGAPQEDSCNILLAHNPDYFPQYAHWGADLVCAGHVHGGVARVPLVNKGVISPNLRFFPRYDGGIFTREKSTMILGRGLGMHTLPVRLFNPGELILLELEPSEEKNEK